MLDGPGLVEFISKVGSALNEREIPSVGSVIDAFNIQLLDRCVSVYKKAVMGVALPAEEPLLLDIAWLAAGVANHTFTAGRFGDGGAAASELQRQMATLLEQRLESNRFASLKTCDSVLSSCDSAMQAVQRQFLMSRTKFDSTFATACNQTIDRSCVGPSTSDFIQRIGKTWERTAAQFGHEYNDRILGVLLCTCIMGAIVFRFFFVQAALELLCWLGLGALELGPRLTMSTNQTAVFNASWWKWVVAIYELVIFNPIYDLGQPGHAENAMTALGILAVVYKLMWTPCGRGSGRCVLKLLRLVCWPLRGCLGRCVPERCCRWGSERS